MNDQTRFQVLGEYFGYPQCCIDDFLRRVDLIDAGKRAPLSKYQAQVHNHKGFVPCKNCAKKVAFGKVTIKQLIQNRKAPRPYPHASLTSVRRYLQSINA